MYDFNLIVCEIFWFIVLLFEKEKCGNLDKKEIILFYFWLGFFVLR